MFSESLKILDQNTVQFMIEEQAEKLAAQLELLDAQADQILAQATEIDAQKEQLEAQANEIDAQKEQLEAQAAKLAHLEDTEYKTYISACQEFGFAKQEVIDKFAAKFQLSIEHVTKKVETYWE